MVAEEESALIALISLIRVVQGMTLDITILFFVNSSFSEPISLFITAKFMESLHNYTDKQEMGGWH